MRNFIEYCKYEMSYIIIYFIILIFSLILIPIYFITEFFPNVVLMWSWLGIGFVISIIITLWKLINSYKKNRDYLNQLYIKICLEYENRDRYINYLNIKK